MTPREVARRVSAGARELRMRDRSVLLEAALLGAEVLAAAAPTDTGGLRTSIRGVPTDDGARIVLDAPHAGIVELGSRPHMPPLQPLIDWVRRQVGRAARAAGIRAPRKPRTITGTLRGAAKASHARSVKRHADFEKEIVAMARSIQRKIARDGTRPTYFVRNALPRLSKILARCFSRRARGTVAP